MTLSCLLVLREGNTDKLVRSSAVQCPSFATMALRLQIVPRFPVRIRTEGVGQVVASLLISVLMLGHKAGTVNGIVISVNRRKEIDEVLEQLERSKSPNDLPGAVIKRARRLTTLLYRDDDIEQVATSLGLRGRCICCGRVRAGGCALGTVSRLDVPGL